MLKTRKIKLVYEKQKGLTNVNPFYAKHQYLITMPFLDYLIKYLNLATLFYISLLHLLLNLIFRFNRPIEQCDESDIININKTYCFLRGLYEKN